MIRSFFAITIAALALWLLTSSAYAASTQTCPSVEGWEWHIGHEMPKKSQEWEWEIPTDTTTNYGRAFYYDSLQDQIYHPWRKVPYKIEWHCVEWETVYDSTACAEIWAAYGRYREDKKSHPFTAEYYPYPNCEPIKECIREIGYREDGMVIWRKKP